MKSRAIVQRLLFAALSMALAPAAARADDAALTAARELYEAANYEQALQALDALNASADVEGADRQSALRYRALCLMALDRTVEAERTLEDMVRADPVSPPEADLPPRMRDLLTQVRQRVARVLTREGYERGRSYYQSGKLPEARRELETVIALLDDPTLQLSKGQSFADLRLVAEGFLVLASAPADKTAQAPEPASASGQAQHADTGVQAADAGRAASPPAAAAPVIVPPRARQQPIPPFNTTTAPGAVAPRDGEIELEVGADGTVTAARMTVPIHPTYDALLLATARRDWKYQPATRDGHPISYVVRIRVVMERQ